MAKKTTPVAKKTKPAASSDPAAGYTDGADTAAKVHPIKVWQEGDVLLDYLHDAPRHREVSISGAPYDHAAIDADGVWIYRNDRKN